MQETGHLLLTKNDKASKTTLKEGVASIKRIPRTLNTTVT
jgi:hypothetical protein